MKFRLFILAVMCMILLCSCSYNYIGELPDGITPKTTQSEVIETFGESQYSYEEIGDSATHNTLVYDYETQYGKCLLEFFFDKETNKLDYVSYDYYGEQEKLINSWEKITNDMKAKYGNDYRFIPHDLDADESADLYRENNDYELVCETYDWNDSGYDSLSAIYIHQSNHDMLHIKELPTCETRISINVFLNL